MNRRHRVVGIAGGVGSGKSTVAAFFRKLGARGADADAIAHRVLKRPAVVKSLVRIWGKSILGNGAVDRAALAAAAFRSKKDVSRLNAALHPAIGRELRKEIGRSARRGGIFALDAPLLFEAGIAGWCDRIVWVEAPRSVRERRVARRGWSPRELRRRERFQWPAARKRARADYVVENGGPKAATKK